MNPSANEKQTNPTPNEGVELPPRLLELIEAFRRLPNPQENKGPPPKDILHFPEDLPYLHRILEDFYRQEGPIAEDENLWPVPYYAWRALGLARDPSSLPVLLDCLEFCDPEENIDEYFEFPALLALYGETLLEQAEKIFSDGLRWKHSAYEAGAILDALKFLAEEDSSYRARIISLIRDRLERYRTNSPLLNAELIGGLAHFKCQESLMLIQRVFEEDLCDADFLPWEDVRKEFPELPASNEPNEGYLLKLAYLGDENFSLALQSAGIQGRLLDKKAFLLGAILHPGALEPMAAAEDFFFDHFTMEPVEWETEGQAKLLYQQFSLLWNELALFQEKPFPLATALEGEMDGIPLGRARALDSFMDEFIGGLTHEETEPGKSWLLRNEFLHGLVIKMQGLENALETEDQPLAEKLCRETLSHWEDGYLPFAKECQAFRLNLLERGMLGQETRRLGRNDPCPCGSGKKFKKCCLV